MARRAHPPQRAKVVLVSGASLRGGEAEIAHLQDIYPDAAVLRGADATVEHCLGAIDGATLVHFASHGVFRADNPMFSSLSMYDGPLTVHDLGRLRHAPYRIIMSACDSGRGSPAGSQELLGLQTALISLGTASIASTVSEVNDAATTGFTLALHRELAAGRSLPSAVCTAQSPASDSHLARATAASFVAFGA